MTAVAPAFEPGALVEARGREWVVLPESEPDLLVLRPLGGGDDERAAVIPELEHVRSARFAPPDPGDAGNAMRAAMLRTALRIGFRSTGGPFRSLGGIAVEPRPYQLVPLLMALRQDTVRLLIADDVGIGKTVESGLVAAELLAQGDADGLAVVCSPALAEQWQAELASKFGILAELVLPSTARRLGRDLVGAESIFDRHRHVIVSTDFIKRPGQREQFLRGCPNLVIVDEAHTCVIDDETRGGRSRMLRYELVKRLAEPADRHLLLVTATPHSGKDSGFRNLIGLLDQTLSTVDLECAEGRERLARHFVQRRRADIRGFLEDTPFPEDRHIKELPYRLTGEYKSLFNDVVTYARQQVRDPVGGQVRQRVRYWSALALLRALASSPMAAAATLKTRAANVDAVDEREADQLGRAAVLDLPDDETYESADMTPGADPEVAGASPERRKLLGFARRAQELADSGDAKLSLLVKEVKSLLGDGFNPVVFCRYIDTAEYVYTRLKQALGKIAEVRAVTGALPPEERAARIAELAADSDTNRKRPVLVATDCLSEGVNLQEHFQAVIHYDLAWNPTRHEQREGRVDRFGQRAEKVRAVMLYGLDNRIDEIVLRVLLRKHEQIRKALGVSVPVPDRSDDVLNAIVQELLVSPDQPEQLVIEGLGADRREELHAEWESAAAKEKQSRAKYAQRAIQPAEVAAELAEVRASLGAPDEVAEFTRDCLTALGADITGKGFGFTAGTPGLPAALCDAFPTPARSVEFHRDLPVPPRQAHLDRTDPYVAALARFVLEGALDPTMPDRHRPARRAGVMRTKAVAKRTTLLLVRFRLHLTLPPRANNADPRTMVAEESRVIGFRGAPATPEWLTDDEVTAMLRAAPSANIAPDQATAVLERVIDGLGGIDVHIDQVGDQLAERLRAAHIRVREAVGQRARRQIAVAAQKPGDLLGVYVYLPDVSA